MADVKITCENVDVSIGAATYNHGDRYLKVSLLNYNLENLLIVLCEDHGKDLLLEKIKSI